MFIEPVARFISPFGTKFGIPRQAGLVPGLKGRIVFEPAFRSADAVRGLEGFEYIWLIWGFSANRPRSATSTSSVTGRKRSPQRMVSNVEPRLVSDVEPRLVSDVEPRLVSDVEPRLVSNVEPQARRPEKTFHATVRPPRLGGNERIGVFASRSPFRPNGLGLSSVRIESIEYDARDSEGRPVGPVINVLGADLMDGTPIYDIKPYVTYTDSHPGAASGFVDDRGWKPLKVEFAVPLPSVAERCQTTGASTGSATGTGSATDKVYGWAKEDIESLKEVLAQDPRPRYQNDPDKEYGMIFNDMDVKFKVGGDTLTVIGIRPATKE